MTSWHELVSRTRAGDCRALELLVRELASIAYPHALLAGGDPETTTRELVIVLLTSLDDWARVADAIARDVCGLIARSEDA